MIDAGLESGVKTVVLMSPLIYGVSGASTSSQSAEPHGTNSWARLARDYGTSVVCKCLGWSELR